MKAIHFRGRVTAIDRVFRHMVDDHGFVRVPDRITNGRIDLEFSAWLKPKLNGVADTTCDPSIFGDARNGCEPHASGLADNVKNGRRRFDASDGVYVRLMIVRLNHFPTLSIDIASTSEAVTKLEDRSKGAILSDSSLS